MFDFYSMSNHYGCFTLLTSDDVVYEIDFHPSQSKQRSLSIHSMVSVLNVCRVVEVTRFYLNNPPATHIQVWES